MGVRIVETALVDAGLLAKVRLDGHFGEDTVAAYAAWQRTAVTRQTASPA